MRAPAAVLALALTGCVAHEEARETAPAYEPPPKAMRNPLGGGAPAIYGARRGHPMVCFSAPHEAQAEVWGAICAPIGRFRRCVENETQLACRTRQPETGA